MTTHATPLPEGERLYNARLAVPHYPRIFEGWARASAAVRNSAPCRLDMGYGPHPMERLDLFLPAGRPHGTLMYIHGGYWRSLDKSDASHVAPAFTAAGYAVAVVNYALCPGVDVETIVAQVRRAARWLAAHHAEWEAPAGRLFACGHSAGGHLAAMLLVTERCVAAAVCVSALYDLRPLLQVPSVVETTRFTSLSVPALSPALRQPLTAAPLLTALGNDENPGFHAQFDVIRDSWRHVHAGHVACPGLDHFTILEALTQPDGAIALAALRLMQSFDTPTSASTSTRIPPTVS
jgi:arylformamidase